MALVNMAKISLTGLRWMYRCRGSSLIAQRLQSTKMTTKNANQISFNSNKCGESEPSKCGQRFKNSPCDTKNNQEVKLPQPAPPPLTKDMPEISIKRSIYCCADPCPDALPRFDLLYYRRSDKAQKSYQQTWDECPELLIKPKVICVHKGIKPKLKKRPRKERPVTACKQEICLKSKTKCPHIRMPSCRAGRKPPSCLTQRKPAVCAKRKAPYPAFSECSRRKMGAKRPIECKCLTIPSICEVWDFHHRQQAIKKPNQC